MSAGYAAASRVSKIFSILRDPPPEFAFEIAADGIAMARTRPPLAAQYVPLAPGVIVPSPVKENVLDPAAFTEAVRKVVPAGGGRGRRAAALMLPDHTVRITVLEFETIPEKEDERRSLIRFRLKKSVPFDIEEAALSYYVQSGNRIVAAIAPAEIVARYEAPFRAAGLHPGLVTVSSLAMLELLPATGSLLVARRSPGVLTVIALKDGIVTIARSLELPADTPDELEEISSDIYPTLAYIEDQGGARPERLFLAGFGPDVETSATRLSVELDLPVEPLDEAHPGLAGYLRSLDLAGNLPVPKIRKTVAA
jgi:type IV pilus assembly protein PilM